jgi:hypothetical protein
MVMELCNYSLEQWITDEVGGACLHALLWFAFIAFPSETQCNPLVFTQQQTSYRGMHTLCLAPCLHLQAYCFQHISLEIVIHFISK